MLKLAPKLSLIFLKPFLFVSLILAFFVVFVHGAGAATLNVPGSYSSIQAAVNAAASGDTVSVNGGTYSEAVTISKSLTLMGTGGATINGSSIDLKGWGGLIKVDNSANGVRISGFRIIDSNYVSIMVSGGNPSNITIDNNFIDTAFSSGILVERSSNVTIDNNEIINAHEAGQGTHNEVLSIIDTDGFDVKNNRIHDNKGTESINAKVGARNGRIHHNNIKPIASAGIYLDAYSKDEYNIEVYNNIIHDGPGGSRGIAMVSEAGAKLSGIKVYNNVVYNNGAYGIVVAYYTGCGSDPGTPCDMGPVDDIQVVNNTVYNNDYGVGWGGGIVNDNGPATNIVFRNNISLNNNKSQMKTQSGTVTENNITSGNPADFFISPGSDFHLKDGAVAINAGSSNAFVPNFDYDGNGRPAGGGYDIGAYEWCTGGGCVTPSPTPVPSGTPIPSGSPTPTPTPPPCNNNIIETPEVCDGTSLAGQDCVTQGFDGGTLSCKSDCTGFNTGNCENDSCNDSDGGPKDKNYDSKGTLTWYDAVPGVVGTGGTIEDVCATGYTHTLNEYDCITSDQPTYEMISQYCTYGCDNGACKPIPPNCGPDDGSCPAGCTDPPDPNCPKLCVPNQGESCISAANICGQTTNGNIQCNGSCSAVAPIPPVCPPGDTCDASGACIHQDTTGGIVPCDRLVDDPATADIDESKPCDLCSTFYMVKGGFNYVMVDIAIPIAVLMLVISGLLYAFSSGDEHRIQTAKTAAYYTILGFVIIFLAWILVAAILQLLGYSNITNWNQVNCVLKK